MSEFREFDLKLARSNANEFLNLFGDYFYLYKKKTSGNLCSCYDQERKSGVADCPNCYGTGFVGGYEKDSNTYRISLSLPTMMMRVTKYGIIIDDSPLGWVSYDCPVEIGDLIAITDEEGSGIFYRFQVKDIMNETLYGRGNIIKKKIDLTFINEGDPLYQVFGT